MSKMTSKTEVLRHKIAREVFGEVDDGDGIREYPSWEIFEKCLEQHKQIQDLEHRLANCIEPKFKIGQEVWFINKRNGYDAQIECGKIENLRIFALKSKIQINYRISDSNCSWYDRHSYRQKELFATEAEVKAKLEELKNE